MSTAAVSTNTAGNPFLTRAYGVMNHEELKALYDEWAETFDDELTGPAQDYVAPKYVAKAIIDAGGKIDGEIFDAGCGTGLSGIALVQAGAKTIDGVDLSPGMLKIAEKAGIYRHLATADLSKKISDRGDASYDVVTCVGTLTHGHVGPVPALEEFARITRKDGVIVATVLDDIWESGGYEAEVGRLRKEGLVDVVSTQSEDYRKGAGVRAKILVLRRM